MKEIYDVVNSKLMELYYVYEEYIWKNEDRGVNINVIFDEGMIYFDLGIEEEDIDSFGIKFYDKDRDIYKYISLRFMISLLRCVNIYQDDNVFFNDFRKPYLSVIVEDKELLSLMERVKDIQKEQILTERLDILKDLYNRIEADKEVTVDFIGNISSRVILTRNLLRKMKV